jgi:tetratricopeptide (TPR) repeat protein
VKPGDAQAKARVAAVDQLIVLEQEKKAAEQSRKKNYDDLIGLADDFFGQKNHVAAAEKYEQALSMQPAETYPRQKLNEIAAIREEQARQEASRLATERAYTLAIENGDKCLKTKEYTKAKDEYTRASGLKPAEQYPREKLAEAEKMITAVQQEQASAKAKAEAYTTAMNNGNKMFAVKSYVPARNQYAEALKQMPDDKLAREQITRIDKILAAPVQQAVKAAETAPASQSKVKAAIPMGELNFKTESEKQKYLSELVKSYPNGITLETYIEPYKETHRYIIVRDQGAQEFRQVWFKTYNGYEFSMNGKPITRQYFQSQVKTREGETYKEIEMQ